MKEKLQDLLERVKEFLPRLKELPALLKEKATNLDFKEILASLRTKEGMLRYGLPAAGVVVVLTLGLWLMIGGDDDSPPEPTEAPTESIAEAGSGDPDTASPANLPPPSGAFLLQPMWHWSQSDPTFQGTGFLIRDAENDPLALTAAHYLTLSPHPPRRVTWAAVNGGQVVGTADHSRGGLGKAGGGDPIDLREDLSIFPLRRAESDAPIPAAMILTLDERPGPELGEAVWLPDKDFESSIGYRWRGGTVAKVEEGFIALAMSEALIPGSRAGTPVFSRRTGHVIGLVSRITTNEAQKTVAFLTPLEAIKQRLRTLDQVPLNPNGQP
ncbi:hypothetical protein SCOR_13770 [Sulfidibacter corallicola]|uniref:Trypsin-like peptidase domain-containing protein n=1 Tax=Sulfidibacter corallicola TaxID=2818388 RepID=A0A8A4TEG2_SULCO|nr:hypothetical protein [Sulfidibacter corallicola]QTD47614.1 hypothetical protein J3U87_18640 [Sulfidibacter corallicola]